jgi:Na+(H+)/acetate symporter ActP
VGATFRVATATSVVASGQVDGAGRAGPLVLDPGVHTAGQGARLTFPAGAAAPAVLGTSAPTGQQWSRPFGGLGRDYRHPVFYVYSLILATFLGTMGLPHILVRFYTNPDGRAARKTTLIVLGLLGVFYLFPAIYGALGRAYTPDLYLTGSTDAVVLVLPGRIFGGIGGELLTGLVAAGAFAAFMSTASGLLISVAGSLTQDLLRGRVADFRWASAGAGVVATALALRVGRFDINELVGWAFAIAASSFCPLLVLGIWWRRLTARGAAAGLLVGGGLSSAAILVTIAGYPSSGWAGTLLSEPAAWTVPLAFATMVVVSRLTTPPPDVAGKMLALHTPEGLGLSSNWRE